MELELVCKQSRSDDRDDIVARPGQKLVFDLVVVATLEGETLPDSVEVFTKDHDVELREIPRGAGAAAGADVVTASGRKTARAWLMRADSKVFYRYFAIVPRRWQYSYTLKLGYRTAGLPEEVDTVTVTPRISVWAVAVLLVLAVAWFGARLVPVALKLAPTNWNVVLGLLLQGAPAALLASLVLGALKSSFAGIRQGEISVLGMRRPTTLFIAGGAIAAVALFLPRFCWRIHNRTPTKIAANWSMFESVDFAAESWVSVTRLRALTEPDLAGLVSDYAERYCAVDCAAQSTGHAKGPVDTTECVPVDAGACGAGEHENAFEIRCRRLVWTFDEKGSDGATPLELKDLSHAELVPKAKSQALVSVKKDTCDPEASVEATTTLDATDVRLIWSEDEPPTAALLRDYVGGGGAPRQALQLQIDGVTREHDRIQLRTSPLSSDTAVNTWLRYTSTTVTATPHAFVVPLPADVGKLELSLVDRRDEGHVPRSLICTRTTSLPWVVRVWFPKGLDVERYEHVSGGVLSYFTNPGTGPDGLSFVAACYDGSASSPPSDGRLRLRSAPAIGAEVGFGAGSGPTTLSVSVKDDLLGTSVCEQGLLPDGSAPKPIDGAAGAPPLVAVTYKSAKADTEAPTSSGVATSWTGPKGSEPWYCRSDKAPPAGANRPTPPPRPKLLVPPPAMAAGMGAAPVAQMAPPCCFSAGQRARLSCAEPGWECHRKPFVSTEAEWLKQNGCLPSLTMECVRSIHSAAQSAL